MAHRMENYPYSTSSYPDSAGDASPPSRGAEIDPDNNPSAAANSAWDDERPLPPTPPPSNNNDPTPHHHHHRVKFMCSYGGKIQPRSHDNQLSYVGGHTKILAVDRSVRYPALLARLSSLLLTPSTATSTPAEAAAPPDVCFKYQLPGEDLDALISVTNDEDLEHMMLEYDRLQRSSTKPARLRLFLFPLGAPLPPASAPVSGFPSPSDPRSSSSDRQWFVDALNSAPLFDSASPPAPSPTTSNPDFLFGLEKGFMFFPAVPVGDPTLPTESKVAEEYPVDDATTGLGAAAATTGSDATRDDKRIGGRGGEPPVHSAEIQWQIQELQRLQIANQEQQIAGQEQSIAAAAASFQQQQQQQWKGSNEEAVPRAYAGDYYPVPKVQVQVQVQEKAPPAPAPPQIPYYQERHVSGGVYASMAGFEHPIYLFPAGPQQGIYPGAPAQPVSSQTSQGYYASQRVVPPTEAVYGVAAPPKPPSKVAGATYPEGGGVVRPLAQGMVEAVGGFPGAQLLAGYDSTGRAVYYTVTTAAGGGGRVPTYQTVTSVDMVRSAAAVSAQQSPAATAGATTAGP